MNIQAEKVELIRLITEIESAPLLKKIRKMITGEHSEKGSMEDSDVSPAMTKRLLESRKKMQQGKGTNVSLDDIWK